MLLLITRGTPIGKKFRFMQKMFAEPSPPWGAESYQDYLPEELSKDVQNFTITVKFLAPNDSTTVL